jgi:hypothetical protein
VNRALGLSVFAIAVLAGCSSPSLPTSTNTPAGHLTGTMSDWTSAVCERGSGPLPMAHGRMLGGAPNPMVCQGLMQTSSGTRLPVPISIGTYTSESLMENDLTRVGAYAKGNDGTEYVVFAALSTFDPSLLAESAMLQPLRAYGFEVFPSPNPSVEPPIPQPLPGSTNAMPPQTPTAELGLTPDGGHLTGGTAGPAGRLSVCRASVRSTPRSSGSRLPAW